jgi:hypothetical protein
MVNKLKSGARFFSKPKYIIWFIILIIAIIGAVISIIYVFDYATTCENKECFTQALVKCEKRQYVNEGAEKTLFYKILGKEKDSCEVKVRLLQLKQGSIELSTLENMEMVCSVPLGSNLYPEENLKNCHGLLKEGIQEIILQRMHAQLIENLGKISQEINQVI